MSVYMKQLVVITLTLSLSHVVVQSVNVTDAEKSDIITRHNVLRASEGAADMELITWDESLAEAAADMVAQCSWGHSFPPLPGTNNFTGYGQNLFIVESATINVVIGIQDWYGEKHDYDYNTTVCAASKVCGHYTQMVWATSRQVGCAYHYCTTVKNSHLRNSQYLVCNYLPGGNYTHQKPYKKGPSCSKCGSGAGWCKDGLCNRQCSKAGKDCTCEAVCHNCGKLDLESCRCSCPDGWSGPDCSERCKDKSTQCNPSPGSAGWPPGMCNDDDYGEMVQRNCPVMCKLCTPNPNAVAGKCPPELSSMLLNSTKSPADGDDGKHDENGGKDGDDHNRSQHQQQRSTVAQLSYLMLSLTITWKASL